MGDVTDTARRGRRRLDRRTIAICVCIALTGALAAALVTSIVIGNDDPMVDEAAALTLDPNPEVDVATMLTIPLETREGDPTDLGKLFDDRPVLLNFWQSTCAPCIREMPLLEQAAEANPDVAVLGIATQEVRPEAAERLAAQTAITYPWAFDPTGDLFYEAQGTGMPTTLVLDTDGTILARETGAFDDLAEVQAFLDAGLAQR